VIGPLRLAVGSHPAGSGYGCAMNVVSWENGDQQITDLPKCADRLLTTIVQGINDTHCQHRRFAWTPDPDDATLRRPVSLLCPPCSLNVLELAHRTVGTNLRAHGWKKTQIRDLHLQLAQEAVDAHPSADSRRHLEEARAAITVVGSCVDAIEHTWVRTCRTNLDRIVAAHRLIDRFEALTGIRGTAPDPAVTAAAVTAMTGAGA
jgi:hypothetical protein